MYESKIKSEAMDRLFAAVARLENEEECYRFFEDLCTINELQAMAQRYEVARFLDQGLTYAQIAEITHASTATISRVNRSLVYGAEGYHLALQRAKQQTEEEE